MNVVAQVLAFLALISYIFSIQQNNKKRILQFQVIAFLLYGIQYFMLQAYSAAFMDIASLASSLLFYINSREKKKPSLFTLIFFILAIGITGIFTITDINSSIPIIMSIIFIFSIWQDDMSIIRSVSLFKSFIYIIYNAVVGAYICAIGDIFLVISAVIAIVRFDLKKKK